MFTWYFIQRPHHSVLTFKKVKLHSNKLSLTQKLWKYTTQKLCSLTSDLAPMLWPRGGPSLPGRLPITVVTRAPITPVVSSPDPDKPRRGRGGPARQPSLTSSTRASCLTPTEPGRIWWHSLNLTSGKIHIYFCNAIFATIRINSRKNKQNSRC